MTRDRRLLLVLALLMVLGLFTAEGRYRQHEDTAPTDSAHHRHRHRHETPSILGKRKHQHESTESARGSWSQELEYEDDAIADSEDEENEEDEEEDYETRSYYERSYPRSGFFHTRTFETRHPPRYHHRPGYRGWYEDEDNDRRRGGPPQRHPTRNYRFMMQERSPHRRSGYSRNHETQDDFEYGEEEDELEFERAHRRTPKTARKHRAGSRYPWQGRNSDGSNHRSARRYHVDNTEASLKMFYDWWRRVNSSEAKQPTFAKHDKRRHNDDYDDHVDGEDGAVDRDQEEDDIWREAEGEDDADDEDELDNSFSKSDRKPPLRTFDDIIRRLTSDEPTSPRTTVKRDYRNIKYVGDFKYEPRNISRSLSSENSKTDSPYVGSTSNYYWNRKTSEAGSSSSLKAAGSPVDRKKDTTGILAKGNDRQEKKATASPAGARKNGVSQPRTKSLEQDYDEYLNSPDTEKEEDLIRAGIDEDSGMQADVTNTDYGEDENVEEDETPATPKSTGKPSITSTSTTTSTTTTSTTTPRNVVTQHYDYRDPRAYDSATGTQYNGYQPKKEYAPMSAHSAQKWQSLGTREGVKETRSNTQQYNKNGKSAEIREALQHAIKVSREGSCQWPRPRVIPVRDVYPSPSTTYIPHCAILHRCSDDTGCCRSDALTCVPKHSHRVELSFYTTSVNGSSVVEKLSFYNHTECECKERTEYDSPSERSAEKLYRHHLTAPQPQNMRRPTAKKPCRCPSQFTPRITPEGKCQCHCYDNNHNCIKTRRGKGYFSLADRTCIEREICAPPICEFGEYMHKPGKCPRREDRFEAIANFRTNLRHRY